MARSRFVAAGAVALVVTSATLATAQEDTDPLAAAQEAAQEAAETAREIAQEAAAAEEEAAEEAAEAADAESGDPRGFGSAAFQQRHADLSEKFAERDHPVFDEHPAARVHAALANGDDPSGLGQDQADAARAMARARRSLDGPPGGGRDGGPPDHAGPSGS